MCSSREKHFLIDGLVIPKYYLQDRYYVFSIIVWYPDHFLRYTLKSFKRWCTCRFCCPRTKVSGKSRCLAVFTSYVQITPARALGASCRLLCVLFSRPHKSGSMCTAPARPGNSHFFKAPLPCLRCLYFCRFMTLDHLHTSVIIF